MATTESAQQTLVEKVAALRAFDEQTAAQRTAQVHAIEIDQLGAVQTVVDALAAPGVATLISTMKGLDMSLSDTRQEQVRAIVGVLQNVRDYMAAEARRITALIPPEGENDPA